MCLQPQQNLSVYQVHRGDWQLNITSLKVDFSKLDASCRSGMIGTVYITLQVR